MVAPAAVPLSKDMDAAGDLSFDTMSEHDGGSMAGMDEDEEAEQDAAWRMHEQLKAGREVRL
jgi:hypothetical protein